MKLSSTAGKLLAVLTTSFLAMMSANAATTMYSFGSYVTGNGPHNPDTFATLTIESSDNKTFEFDLRISDQLEDIFNDYAYVSLLRVNTYSGNDPVSTTIATGTWGVDAVKFSSSGSNTGGVAWDFKDSFCGATGGCNKNAPSSRLTEGEEVKWTSVFSTVQDPLLASQGMLIKVQGYDWQCDSSASAQYLSVVSSVPEPESYAMMLAGLGFMGVVARRRKAKSV